MINNVIRKKLAGIIIWRIHKVLKSQRNEYFKTKSKKLNFLTKAIIKLVKHEVHVINLSAHQLTLTKKSQLRPGLEYSFLDKNKNRGKFQAANLESVCQRVDDEINQKPKEDLHEFIRGYTDIFMKNVDDSKDYTYKIFKLDKDSSVIIIDKNDYINKRESMINEGIDKGT